MDNKTQNNMPLNHRRSIRLKNYDYSKIGFYFVTICTKDHMHLLGEITDGKMSLSKSGEIVEKEWYKTGGIRPNINLHEFVIMPNHLHGIIEISGNTACRGTPQRAHENGTGHCEKMGTVPRAPTIEIFGKPSRDTIPTIIRSYKAIVTKQVRELENDACCSFWQRNYYEHIIRNEESYLKIAEYIRNNPEKWLEDKYYNGKSI
jgi:putative transposase